MEFEIIPKKSTPTTFDANHIAIKYIEDYHTEYYTYNNRYQTEEITPELIAKLLQMIPKGLSCYFFLDANGECDWLEVVSDRTWISLGCCFEDDDGNFDCYYCYNADFAHTASLIDMANFSDETIYTAIESGGQSPIPKIQALQDMELGIKAVEYFIHTGKLYPKMEWLRY